MKILLQKPVVFFDIEATGLSVVKDRIVEIALLKVFPDGNELRWYRKLNPTIPISAEATSIHGISDSDVAQEPKFSDIAPELFEFIADADLGGFNALKFDIPMLMEEFLRVGIEVDLKCREVIDVQVIFHKMEERTLSAAYKFYCNKNLENAHTAEADTHATFEIFKAQLDRYAELHTDIRTICEFTGQNKRVDLEGRIMLNSNGQEIFNFGKHKGRLVEEVFTKEPTYYNWMMDGEFPAYTKKVITDIRLRLLKKKFQG